jgi:hypothetical protein
MTRPENRQISIHNCYNWNGLTLTFLIRKYRISLRLPSSGPIGAAGSAASWNVPTVLPIVPTGFLTRCIRGVRKPPWLWLFLNRLWLSFRSAPPPEYNLVVPGKTESYRNDMCERSPCACLARARVWPWETWWKRVMSVYVGRLHTI